MNRPDERDALILQSWLDLLCPMIPKVQRGIVVGDLTGDSAPVASWPSAQAVSAELLAASKLAANSRTPLFHPAHCGAANAAGTHNTVNRTASDNTTATEQVAREAGAAAMIVAYPLIIADQLYGVVAIEADIKPAQQAVVKQLLQWGQAWLALLVGQSQSQSQSYRGQGNSAPLSQSRGAVSFSSTLTASLQADTLSDCLRAMVVSLAKEFSCQRVAIGLPEQSNVTLKAISDSPHFDRKTSGVRLREDLMKQVADNKSPVIFPDSTAPPHAPLTVAHQRLAAVQQDAALCSIPLLNQQAVIGVLVLERHAGQPFSADERDQAAVLSDLLGPVLAMKREQQAPLRSHLKKALAAPFGKTALGGGRGLSFGLLAMLLIGVLVMALPGEYRVSAPAKLEGKVQRAVVSPFDGYVRQAHHRAGDRVASGEVIAELDSRELLLEQQRLDSQKSEQSNQYRQALASLNRSEARIYQSQVSQSDAQLEVISEQLQRTQLVSPLEGIIIAGDLSRSLGAPVERGQVLFEIAPLHAYRLVLQVDESEVADVRVGQQGLLTLTALPQYQLPFVIEQISTVFEQDSGKVQYRTEARVDADPQLLRPGMQGVGKITIDRRSYGWILFHDMADWIRLKVWLWTP